jgi:hypothetical protein
MPRPRKKEDVPFSLHPLSFEEALKKLLNTPPVNPAKRKKRGEAGSRKKRGG